jgi:hypothetical protein
MRKLYDEEGAGRYLGGENAPISPRTMQRMRQTGDGPRYVKIGGGPRASVRYEEAELDRYLDQRRRQNTSEPRAA